MMHILYANSQASSSESSTTSNQHHQASSPVNYEDKITNFKAAASLDVAASSADLTANEFFCQKLFDILIGQLYLIPIWSGIIIKTQNFGYSTKSRLSNNPVENWIGQVKNNILKDDIVRCSKF